MTHPTTRPRRSSGTAALGLALALTAVLAAGCAVPDGQPTANVGGAQGGSGTFAGGATPSAAAPSPRTTAAPAHSSKVAGTAPKGAPAAKTGGAATGTSPKDPVPSAVDLAALLLAPADLDRTTWDVLENSDSHGGPTEHKMCAGQFPSDASWRTRADGTVIRHTDSLRVEQEADGYAGTAARAAVQDFANAFAQCHDYVTGSGAGKLIVHIQVAGAPTYGDAAVAADETLTSGQATVYAHIVVVAQAHLLLFTSVVGDSQDAVAAQQAALVDTAVRKAHVREG